MKKNTFYIDNRVQWKIKRLMHENVISKDQLDDLPYFKSKLNKSAKHNGSFRSVIHSFRYMFN